MATVEHALPIPTIYDDILHLYAQSGTGTTPTLLVHYGGAWGEQLVWQQPLSFDQKCVPTSIIDPLEDSIEIPLHRLRRFVRHDSLESISESTSRPKDCK
jgi:hypothetical protein